MKYILGARACGLNVLSFAQIIRRLQEPKEKPLIGIAPLETCIFGAILATMGLLLIGRSFGLNELEFLFGAIGFLVSGTGSYIFVTRFRTLIERLL